MLHWPFRFTRLHERAIEACDISFIDQFVFLEALNPVFGC